jgi:hypothetical protein
MAVLEGIEGHMPGDIAVEEGAAHKAVPAAGPVRNLAECRMAVARRTAVPAGRSLQHEEPASKVEWAAARRRRVAEMGRHNAAAAEHRTAGEVAAVRSPEGVVVDSIDLGEAGRRRVVEEELVVDSNCPVEAVDCTGGILHRTW